jgi:hypothetical protein
MEKEHQTMWDQFPPNVKHMILSTARQRGIDCVLNRRSVVPDKIPPINKTSNINFRQDLITGKLHESDQYVANSDDLDRSLFINMAKSRVSPSDIRAVLSSSLNRQPPKSALKTGKYSMSFHSLKDPHHASSSFWNHNTLWQCFCFILGVIFLVYSVLIPKHLDHDVTTFHDTVTVI